MVFVQELEELGPDLLQNMPLVFTFPCNKLHEQVGRACGLTSAAPPCPRGSPVGVPSDFGTCFMRAEVYVVY